MSLLRRAWGLFRSKQFRHHPINTISRRLAWRLHWRFRPSRPFIVSAGNGFKIRLANSSASSGIYFNGGFSDRTIADLFIHFLKLNMVAIDCGAHIGEYTLLFSSLVGAKGEVHAFEPDPRLYPVLEENVERDHMENVVLNKVGLSENEGAEAFYLALDPTASSLLPNSDREDDNQVIVPTMSLDTYIKRLTLRRVDAIKIDVEGVELRVLRGAEALLREQRPGLIFVECDNQNDIVEVEHLLRATGYSVEKRSKNPHGSVHLVATS